MTGRASRGVLFIAGASVALALGGCSTTPATSTTAYPGEPAAVPSAGPAEAPTPHAGDALTLTATTQGSSAPGWDFTGSAYLWVAQKRGVIVANDVGIPLDDPDESSGAFLYLEGERGRWGFIADLVLISTDDETDGLTAPIEIEEDTLIGEVDATFRPLEGSALQFLAGVRVLDSSQDIDFPILPDASSEITQVDPVVGAQGTWPVGESFVFRLRGDVGGFGLDSDLTYQMLGIFGWEFSDGWRLTGGYRMIGWEFEADGIYNDLRLSGPLLGITASF